MGQYSDRYWGRIIFPIENHRGQVVGFGARVFGDGPVSVNPNAKYVNTSETILFQKHLILYGLSQAQKLRDRSLVVLTEGYLDVQRAIAHSLPACAAMGTALSPDQAKLIGRNFEKVVIALDGDEAGRAATHRFIPILVNQGCETLVYRCVDGGDIDTELQDLRL